MVEVIRPFSFPAFSSSTSRVFIYFPLKIIVHKKNRIDWTVFMFFFCARSAVYYFICMYIYVYIQL
ncbi:unnamed protein product [Meloidogyne enterolobii]|uniref:Uncharacterized protein n=1 Tax=Meloidogyne enterolobii TaxID=390850 RepID=A0ACB1AIB8_MELEN